jgi:hypothetical protein
VRKRDRVNEREKERRCVLCVLVYFYDQIF